MSIAAMMFAVNANAGNSTLVNNLAGYWKFDGNSQDSVGNNDGYEESVDYMEGMLGDSVGVYGILRLDHNPHIGKGPFSIFCWVYLWYNDLGPVISYGDQSPHQSNGLTLMFEPEENKLLFMLGDTVVTKTENPVPLNQWVHIGVTYDDDSNFVQLYVNSDTAATRVRASPDIRGGEAFVGCTNGSLLLNGSMDELGVWTRVLTLGEIKKLYNAGNGTTYPF